MVGLLLLTVLVFLLQLAKVTDVMNHGWIKDPERKIPDGNVIVSPADGTVIYVKRIDNGMMPVSTKEGVSVPINEHLKTESSETSFKNGYLIGIYMNTQGVHISRMPTNGQLLEHRIFNGPHMVMDDMELKIIKSQLIPGVVTAKKLFGIPPFDLEKEGDYILKSARDVMEFEDERGATIILIRIADYWLGKLLTWINEGENIERGEKIGYITWGSQTDIFIEDTPGLEIVTSMGEYVYGGQTVIAEY